MNKLGVVLGIAAVATLAGCKNPDYKRTGAAPVQDEVKNVETAPAVADKPVAVDPVVQKCTCPPGTKHTSPCECGASDCKCVVEEKPVIVADVSKKPAEPEYTIYIVQNGDYLAKISKKFNVTIASIKRLNPSVKNDVIRIGQKLKLPGKIDVGEQEAPKDSAPVAKSAKKSYVPYTGATKEYVVKSGDTLGSIAYGNGINIRQLKALNGLSSDSLKIGQKLKIPAEKVAKASAPVVKKEPAVQAETKKNEHVESPVEASAAEVVAPAETKAADTVAAPTAAKPAEVAASNEAKPAVEMSAPATTTYVVQEGDDMIGVAIRWGVTAAEVRELNNLTESDKLVPGQIIKLPADAQQ